MLVGSLSFTPSTTTTVWPPSAPRIRRVVDSPTPPLRMKLTPGVVARKSEITTTCRATSWAWSITVTCWPTLSAASGERVAVTTSSLTPLATSRPATSGVGVASSAAWAAMAVVRATSAVAVK